jgi:hypothetical protein
MIVFAAMKRFGGAALSTLAVLASVLCYQNFALFAPLRATAAEQQESVPPMAPVVVRWAEGGQNADQYYSNGALLRSVTSSDAVNVTLTIHEAGKWVLLSVGLENDGNTRPDVLPDSFTVELVKPLSESLAYQRPEQVEKAIRNNARWRAVVAGGLVGMGESSPQTTTSQSDVNINGTVTDSSGNSSSVQAQGTATTTSQTTNPEAGKDARRAADGVYNRAAASIRQIQAGVLRPSTLFPGKFLSGLVYFKKPKQRVAEGELLVKIPVGHTAFEFSFPWPQPRVN